MRSLRNVRIETPRLILREFKPSDWRDVQAYASIPKVCRFMPWGPNTPAQTRAFLKMVRTARRCKPRRSFELAMLLKFDGRLMGACGIRVKNPAQREADLGYVLHPDYWNQGYTTEAARALLDFGFDRLKIHRVWSTHDPKNPASGKVMRKIGMKREGTLRSHLFMKGKWRSSWLYAVLETDRRPKSDF